MDQEGAVIRMVLAPAAGELVRLRCLVCCHQRCVQLHCELAGSALLESGAIGSSRGIPVLVGRVNVAFQCKANDFVRTLPTGFDYEVRERGLGLSTGQKQLVGFARALARQPRYLILDEATSSVDTDTEVRIRQALDRLVTGRTSIVIAHRLSTIQRADRILVMHKGQLRESGTHQQLLALDGLYTRLYQLQYQEQEVGPGAAA